jgi:hypothetical protein
VTPLSLIERQLALEGIGFDANGRLVSRTAADPTDVPRFYVARHPDGVNRFYRVDLPDEIVARLAELPVDVVYADVSPVKNILREHALCRDVWLGASYTFPAPPPPSEFPDVAILTKLDRPAIERFDRDLLYVTRPIFAIVVDGEIASTCVSAREDDHCAEAWVQTSPSFRRRGFGRQVTAAWGSNAVDGGRVAFYSHAQDNVASRGIATSLGLTWFLDGAGYL